MLRFRVLFVPHTRKRNTPEIADFGNDQLLAFLGVLRFRVCFGACQEKAHKHKSFWPVTPPVTGGSPDREARGQSFMCYPRSPSNIIFFSGYPTGRTGDWGGRKKFMCKSLMCLFCSLFPEARGCMTPSSDTPTLSLQFAEKKKAHKLKKIPRTPAGCPWETRRDKQGSTGRCPRGFLLFTKKEKLTEKGMFAGTPAEGHPAIERVFRNFMCFLLMCLFCSLNFCAIS